MQIRSLCARSANCPLKKAGARLGVAGNRHFLGSWLGFLPEGSLCPGPSVETSGDVGSRNATGTFSNTCTCLHQPLCNQGNFSGLVDTTAHLTIVRSIWGDWFYWNW